MSFDCAKPAIGRQATMAAQIASSQRRIRNSERVMTNSLVRGPLVGNEVRSAWRQRTPARFAGAPRLAGAAPAPGAPAPGAPTPTPGVAPAPGAPAPTPGVTPTPGAPAA